MSSHSHTFCKPVTILSGLIFTLVWFIYQRARGYDQSLSVSYTMPSPTSAKAPQFVDSILEKNESEIERIRELFNVPSFAIGVVHKGQRSFKSFGYANEETQLQPNESTIYGMGSCTKAFTSTVLSLLSQDGQLRLDERVSVELPSLNTTCNPRVAKQMTVRDMASHCVGLNQLVYEVVGKYGDIFTKRSDVIDIFNHLPQVAEFHDEWQYNNWLFALAGVMITELDDRSFGTVVKEEIFTKFRMDRSYFTFPSDDNFASPYLVFDDGRPAERRPLPSFGDGDAFDSSGSLRSCVKDMLTWSDALMEVWRTANSRPTFLSWLNILSWFKTGKRSATSSIPPELQDALATIQTPYFPLAKDPKQKYAMGLYTFNLPTTEINTVTNTEAFTTQYELGRDSENRVVVGHTGEYGGFLSVYWTFPEDDTAIVVLCNSYGVNGDPTNIVAQLVAQELFDMKPRIDLVQVSEEIVSNTQKVWTDIRDEWTSHKVEGTRPGSLDSYTGYYKNQGLAMSLNLTIEEDAKVPSIRMMLNELPEQVITLNHYHHDSWTFLPETRDECIAKGLAAYISTWECFVLEFEDFENGKFREVKWKLDPDPRVSQTSFTRQ